jgi:hypothetical protein
LDDFFGKRKRKSVMGMALAGERITRPISRSLTRREPRQADSMSPMVENGGDSKGCGHADTSGARRVCVTWVFSFARISLEPLRIDGVACKLRERALRGCVPRCELRRHAQYSREPHGICSNTVVWWVDRGNGRQGRLSCLCHGDPNQSPKSWNKQKVATSNIPHFERCD